MFPPTTPTATFPYRIIRKVGEGAMGEVYRAEDLDLGRDVAIKVIRAEQGAAVRGTAAHATVQRFLQEARAAAALTHPGVTTVHRVGTEAGRPYIAMEWLDGRTLEAVLAERGRIPVEQAARLGIQVLSALEAAHAAGIIHRDIKPGNLMVMTNGRIKVTDFGVARVRGSNLAHTQAGTMIGTPQYAAPEQLASAVVDNRADLYALACVLYEAVVGHLPIEAATMYELVQAVHTRAPIPPSVRVDGVPAGFDDVILRALAKRPEERFPSAIAMRTALYPYRNGSSKSSRREDRRAAVAEIPAVAATLARVPAVTCTGTSDHELVTGVVRQWPATVLAAQPRDRLLQRLLERPLNAPAFSGAIETRSVCLLVSDGIIYRAFEPATGRSGDDLIEALPDEIEGTLRAVPVGHDVRIVPLLASLLLPAVPRLSGLSSSFADLPHLAAQLSTEGFDGALRFTLAGTMGVVLFSRGQRVLDVFGAAWPASSPWESWIGGTGALASVEPLQTAFPAITFRQQLEDLSLDVVRPGTSVTSSIRTDTVAAAHAIELRPSDAARVAVRRGESMLQALVDADPAYDVARWVVTELGSQFEQHGRADRWKGLIAPLSTLREIRLHHPVTTRGGGKETFDVATFGGDGRLVHVVDRVALGSRAAVEAFVARVTAAKESSADASAIAGAILVSRRFDDDALEAYLAALRQGGSLLAGLDAFAHRDGFLRLGLRRGFHLLLVEESAGGHRRPLVIE